jgi:hypothetical protein
LSRPRAYTSYTQRSSYDLLPKTYAITTGMGKIYIPTLSLNENMNFKTCMNSN